MKRWIITLFVGGPARARPVRRCGGRTTGGRSSCVSARRLRGGNSALAPGGRSGVCQSAVSPRLRCMPTATACRRTMRRPSLVSQGSRPRGRHDAQTARLDVRRTATACRRITRQGVAWYRKAADQGIRHAQVNLGVIYGTASACRRTTSRPRVVPQGGRPGERVCADQPRRDVRTKAKACRRTTCRPTCGSTWPPAHA